MQDAKPKIIPVARLPYGTSLHASHLTDRDVSSHSPWMLLTKHFSTERCLMTHRVQFGCPRTSYREFVEVSNDLAANPLFLEEFRLCHVCTRCSFKAGNLLYDLRHASEHMGSKGEAQILFRII